MEAKKRDVQSARNARYLAENQALRDTIFVSNYHLQKCQKELDVIKYQLKCLIHYVKRAWSGDIEASIHVANIVGIAPPDLSWQNVSDVIVAAPKRAAINNWACLTIGLLKREYSKKENERQEKQLAYLLERESFLDHHLDGFIQDPDMRTTKDTALIINSEMLRSFMEGQDLRDTAAAELQIDLQEQQRKLANKQRFLYSRPRQGSWKTENSIRKHGDNTKEVEFTVDAIQSQLVQKTTPPKKNRTELTAPAKSKKDISAFESFSSVKKMLPPEEKSKPSQRRGLKVLIGRRVPRPFSSEEPNTRKVSCDSPRMMNYQRRRSLDCSFRSRDGKKDDIERELRKCIPNLEKKLNINPDGYLKF